MLKHLLSSRYVAIATAITVLIILLLQVNVRISTARYLLSKQFVADDLLHRTVKPAQRKSLLIIGEGGLELALCRRC